MTADRIHRLLKLITLLRAGTGRSTDELLHETGASRRTLYRDLKLLQDAGVPCYHEPGRGYRIAEAFQLPPTQLHAREVLALLLVGKRAASQPTQPLMEELGQAVGKLASMLSAELRHACSDLVRHVSHDPHPLPSDQAQTRHFIVLQRCIDEHRQARVTLRHASPSTVKPILLHWADDRWHLVWLDKQDQPTVTPLGRLERVEPTDATFDAPRRTSFEAMIGRPWRVETGPSIVARLRFQGEAAEDLRAHRWHASQVIESQEEHHCIVRFQVDGEAELARWLLRFGAQVRVLEPLSLRDRLASLYRAALEDLSAAN